MPLITEAVDYFIGEKTDIAQNFLSALSMSRKNLDNYLTKDDELILDFHICQGLYIVTSICEAIKGTYSQHAAAEEIAFSADLKNINLNCLRNYLYHDFIIPENRDKKLSFRQELSELLYELECSLKKEQTINELSKNTFLKKVDKILMKKHAFDHFGGQNIFLRARNIQELCSSFPTSIYAISAIRTPKINLSAKQEILNNIIFSQHDGYFFLLNNLEKHNDFEKPIETNEFSQHIKKCISEELTLWAEDSFHQTDYLTKIPGKGIPGLQKSREHLLRLSKEKIDFQENKFSEISDFLSKKINEVCKNTRSLGVTLKIKVYTKIINIIQKEQGKLIELLKTNTNEIDEPLVKCYISSFKNLFSTIYDIEEKQLKDEYERARKESHYELELQKALAKFYHSEPEGYKKLIHYLIQAISLQTSSYMPPFLKKCTNIILRFEDNDHCHTQNLAREAFFSEISRQHSRITCFIKILRKIIKNKKLFNYTNIPLFGCEMYLIVCMNTCLKNIENIAFLTEDIQIQEQILYIRSELNMRSQKEIETLNPHEMNFFELISSHSGIGKSIADFRHYRTKLDPKSKENIQWIYSAFSKETPYHSPENGDMLNFTDLFKTSKEVVKSATGSNKAKKIMKLCFDRSITYRLNTLFSPQQDILKIEHSTITPIHTQKPITAAQNPSLGFVEEIKEESEQKKRL